MVTDPAIVAIASPPGRSARGLVRLSGTGVHEAIRDLELGTADDQRNARGVRMVRLRLPVGAVPAIAIHCSRPRSFTGEDTVELLLPGNGALLDCVVTALLDSAERLGIAARHARPGEFTARAFLNGRIDLSEAEGVATAIAATTDRQLRAARLLAEGHAGRAAQRWIDRATDLLALVEAGIDFTDEEDVVAIAPERLRTEAAALADEIARTVAGSLRADVDSMLPVVVLRGAPNAGKSTLFNALLGTKRVVASELSGTTRDAITAPLTLAGRDGPLRLLLVDVAGDEDAQDALGELAQSAVTSASERADLVVHCVDTDDAPANDFHGVPHLRVRTKGDLCSDRIARDDDHRADPRSDRSAMVVCALTGDGLDALRNAISAALESGATPLADAALALTARHVGALRGAATALRSAAAIAMVDDARTWPAELSAAELRRALDELGSIGGRVMADDVLGAIFGRFCIGK